jgi:hypothetical protein
MTLAALRLVPKGTARMTGDAKVCRNPCQRWNEQDLLQIVNTKARIVMGEQKNRGPRLLGGRLSYRSLSWSQS